MQIIMIGFLTTQEKYLNVFNVIQFVRFFSSMNEHNVGCITRNVFNL